MENSAIQINNLVKEYKMFSRKKDRLLEAVLPNYERHTTFKAIDNLNLEIKKGEVLGILGKNGAGKSTLLKMITGVVAPTSGELKVEGKISSLLELGAAFNPDLTGMENIYQHGQVMGLTDEEIKAKEKEIIDFADIGEHLSQPVKTYSSGMFARLAFACAINVDPDILIVDEVLSVGDIAFQLKCFKKFEQFKESGKTILFVTHSVDDVLRNCTRAIIMQNGRKTYDGDVKTGVEKYKKFMVGIEEKEEETKEQESKTSEYKYDGETWKSKMTENPKLITYGNGKAEVIDYGAFDKDGHIVNVINSDEEITFKSKVLFKEKVKNPIFTMTVKDFSGKEMAGTNTDIEKVATGEFEKGDIVVAEFTQKIPLVPGKYTLSFSCTRYTSSGELEALNRKYDALLVEFTTSKRTVGLLNIDSKIKIHKIEKDK